ncbi:DUF3108 domain-containing protein [uncultured Oxalicibacterium sp.]|uniref:DUF3108 domain-containing protein n=1 Tax=uncultured Oxalicibacterium sp. TaxID=1168540 RepID=UPI0025F2B27D|nr:DUF3108 domain-containing protein [uncultured Oxalicibacterium sp.]
MLLSLLLHTILIVGVSDLIPLPTPAASHDYKQAEVVAATLITPPAMTTPAQPTIAAKQVMKKQPVRQSKPMPQTEPTIERATADATTTPTVASTEEKTATSPQSTSSEAHAAEEHADASTPNYRVSLLPSALLRFDVEKTPANGSPMHGSGTICWQADPHRYEIEGEFGVLFITALRFTSSGSIEDTGIAPELYAEKRMRRAETNTHFHRERQTISFSASTNSYPRAGNEQDRASIIWQLAGIGRGDPTLIQPGASLHIVVAGTRTAEPWDIAVIGKEAMRVDGKEIETWRLLRAPRARFYDQTLEIWLAPELGWYPVRLRYTEPNGDVLDMVLTRLNVSASAGSQ